MTTNKTKTDQTKCTRLDLSAPVALMAQQDAGNDNPPGFSIVAYTGAVVDRWWGRLAIEVDGIRSKTKMPVLLGHEDDRIVGWTERAWKADGSFQVSGRFSGVTDAAREARELASEGFPWQASIGVRPLKTLWLEDDKVSHTVNGQELHGPAEVWTEAEVFEVSFVPLGADDNTSVATFSRFEEVAPPQGAELKQAEKGDQPMPITMEQMEKEAPELLHQIRTQAADAERARIQAVLEAALPGHDALVQKLAFDGKTTAPEAAMQILAAEKQIRTRAANDLKADAVDPVPPVQPVAPAPVKKDPATAEEFAANGDLVDEFGDWETFQAFQSATKKGLVRILKNREE